MKSSARQLRKLSTEKKYSCGKFSTYFDTARGNPCPLLSSGTHHGVQLERAMHLMFCAHFPREATKRGCLVKRNLLLIPVITFALYVVYNHKFVRYLKFISLETAR